MDNDLLLDDQLNDQPLTDNKSIAEANKLRDAVNESTKAIRSGRIAMIFILIFAVIGAAFSLVKGTALASNSVFVFFLFIVVYTACLFLLPKHPVAGIGIGLSVYAILVTFSLLVSGFNITSVIMRLVILFLFGNALYHAIQLPKRVHALQQLSFTEEDAALVGKYRELKQLHYLQRERGQTPLQNHS